MSGLDAWGTKFKRGNDDNPQTFTAIGHVTDISGPGLKRDTVDTTDHDSPQQWEEHQATIKRSGEVTLELNYDPSVHNALLVDLADTAPRNYQLVFPDSPPSTWAFAAWLTGFEPGAPHDDKLSASATFKLTGPPTFS